MARLGLISLFCLLHPLAQSASDLTLPALHHRITSLPGLSAPVRPQESGYAAGIFYWYVPAAHRSEETPLLIFISGGPGTSSLYGFFEETGPYTCAMHAGQPQLRPRPSDADWSQFADYIVFDQPLGIGLSATQEAHYPRSPEAGTTQFYNALMAFFNTHPTLATRPLVLASESYGATYSVLLADRLAAQGAHPVHGLIFISPWLAPKAQLASVPDYAYQHGLLSQGERDAFAPLQARCYRCRAGKQGQCYRQCAAIEDQVIKQAGLINFHDISQLTASNWQKADFIRCLNTSSLQAALGLSPPLPYSPMTDIWTAYGDAQLRSAMPLLTRLYQSTPIRLLVISGLNDGSTCNPLGVSRLLKQLAGNVPRKATWASSAVKNSALGYRYTYGPRLNWLTVRNAGHTVPADQPAVAGVVHRWLASNNLSWAAAIGAGEVQV
jgi:carboxypeptidase C (cathepsin A)